jgi:hypothetical protein
MVTSACGHGQSVMHLSTSNSLRTPTGLYACVSRVPSGEYNLSARRIKSLIRRRDRGYRAMAGKWYVPENTMLASVLLSICVKVGLWIAGSDKAETKL